jgi:hypothetical protein
MSSAFRATQNLEDQVSVFTSPTDRVAQLYPQALAYTYDINLLPKNTSVINKSPDFIETR